MKRLHDNAALRVCIVAPYDLALPGGGVKHHVFGLANALRARGDSVTILGPASRPFRESGVVTTGGIFSLDSNGSANEMPLFASPFETMRFFQSRQFDLIHIHEPPIPSLAYWATWLTPGIPKIATFHAYADAPPALLRLGQRIIGALQNPFFARGLAVSRSAAEYAARVWKRPLSIVPNGVDPQLFAPSPPRPHPDPVRLLFVGRLGDQRKGWTVMLKAYELLLARGVNVALDVVGELGAVPAPPELKGLSMHGPLALRELVERYRACDIFIAPSLSQESFGIVLLEAMAIGRPIVCSDIRGYREVARPGGASFVPPGDPEQLALAISSLSENPIRRATMRAMNLELARSYYWPTVAEQVRGHYLDVLLPQSTPVARQITPITAAGSSARTTSKRLASTNPASNTGTV